MKIEDIIFWILFVIVISLIIWFLFGESPTLEQLLLITLIGLFVKLQGDIKEIKGDYFEFKRNTINSFKNIKKDLKREK